MRELVIVCSGAAEGSGPDRLIGWQDNPLSEEGIRQARQAGKILRENGYRFDLAYTSILRRGIESLWEILAEMNLFWIKENKSWRLNGRYYGQLEGMSYEEIIRSYGEDQFERWLKSYQEWVPPVQLEDPGHPSHDPRYSDLIPEEMPLGENLLETFSRVYPHWDNKIAPMVRIGRKVLVVGHQNSIRAIMTMVEGLDADQVFDLEISPEYPLVYTLDSKMKFISKEVLKG